MATMNFRHQTNYRRDGRTFRTTASPWKPLQNRTLGAMKVLMLMMMSIQSPFLLPERVAFVEGFPIAPINLAQRKRSGETCWSCSSQCAQKQRNQCSVAASRYDFITGTRKKRCIDATPTPLLQLS